jgi:glycosyltransferase involved in cell wall biosynthesis
LIDVLFDHQIFQSQAYGGISRYYKEIIPRLAPLKTGLFEGFSINNYNLSAEIDFHWQMKTPSWMRDAKIDTKINRLHLPLHLLLKKPKILHHTYYRNELFGFSGRRVATYYDSTHELFPQLLSSADPTIAWKKKTLPLCDLIICISKSAQENLIEHYGISERKTKVIHLANPLPVSTETTPLFVQPYILFVGQRGAYKNFVSLAQAVANSSRLKDFSLVCFGGEAFSKNEIQQFSELKLTERTHFISGGDTQLGNLYRHASLFCFPSLYEGFGLPSLEAMAHSCPVLGHIKGSSPEICADAALLGDMSDVEFINTELRTDLITKGLAREKNFSWQKCAAEHVSAYRELL